MPCLQKNGAVTPQYRQRLCPAAQGRFFSCRIRSVGRAVVSKKHRPLVRIRPPSLREGYYKTEPPVPGSDTGVLGGRGWITQAAHLKKPRRGFFPRRTIRRVDAVRIRPHENPNFLQTENRQRISTLTVFLWARVDSNHRS